MTDSPTRAEICAIACAELFRDAGEIMASPMATVPSVGARLARLTFSPTWCSPTGGPHPGRHPGDREGRPLEGGCRSTGSSKPCRGADGM